jgi:hypothetical protein
MTRKTTPVADVRCAIYTRKSSEEGLEQEFNSLDAQRESAEAYIASQRGEGWVAVPVRYDDGGYTGGNTDRPALQRLLADIEAGRIDCVVVYEVDRLSRSLMDFATTTWQTSLPSSTVPLVAGLGLRSSGPALSSNGNPPQIFTSLGSSNLSLDCVPGMYVPAATQISLPVSAFSRANVRLHAWPQVVPLPVPFSRTWKSACVG